LLRNRASKRRTRCVPRREARAAVLEWPEDRLDHLPLAHLVEASSLHYQRHRRHGAERYVASYAAAPRQPAGPPPKFREPRRPITVTLPERTLRGLARESIELALGDLLEDIPPREEGERHTVGEVRRLLRGHRRARSVSKVEILLIDPGKGHAARPG
jgi:hypothetical protein